MFEDRVGADDGSRRILVMFEDRVGADKDRGEPTTAVVGLF
jgi:hypothetical protein